MINYFVNRVLEVAGNTLISQEKRFRYVTIEIGKMMKVLETHSSKSSTTLAGNLTGTSTPSAVTATTTANSGATGSVVQVPDLNRQFSTDVMRSISVDELDDLHNNDAPHSPTPNASSTIAGKFFLLSTQISYFF